MKGEELPIPMWLLIALLILTLVIALFLYFITKGIVARGLGV